MRGTTDERRSGVRFAVTTTLGLTALVVGGLGLAVLLWAFAGPLIALDAALADLVNALVSPYPVLVRVFAVVTALGDTITGGVVLGTLVLAVLARGRTALALYVAVTGLGGLVIGPSLKLLVGRLRPVVEAPIAAAGGLSFPSGHALTVTLWVGVVILVMLPVVPIRARRPVVAAAVGVVIAVGLTRLGLGVHYLSDVVAGWLLGATWLAVTTTAFRAWRRAQGRADLPLARGIAPEAAPDLVPTPEHGPPPEHPGARIAQLVVIAVLLVGALVGAGWLISRVDGNVVAAADLAVVRWFAAHRTAELDAVSGWVAEFGNTGIVIAVGLVAAVLAVAVQRRLRPVLLLAAAIAGQLVLFLVVTLVVARPRPPVSHLDTELPPTSSFPSGHTGAALCLYGAIALLVFGATRAWWRWLVVATAVTIVVLVALARLYRGAHHPSDVLGSVLLATPWLIATMYLLPTSRSRPSAEPAAGRSAAGSAACGG